MDTANRSSEVDSYIAGLTQQRRQALRTLRDLILEAVPEAEETMRYRMPTYVLGDAIVCAFAAQKHYMSLYLDVPVLDRYRDRLQHLDVGKSCVRFRRLEQLELSLVQQMLREIIGRLTTDEAAEG